LFTNNAPVHFSPASLPDAVRGLSQSHNNAIKIITNVAIFDQFAGSFFLFRFPTLATFYHSPKIMQ